MTAAVSGADDLLHLVIREEAAGGDAPIDRITQDAFRDHPDTQQTEHRIVRALRDSGALLLSLAAIGRKAVVGLVAFSSVTIDGLDRG